METLNDSTSGEEGRVNGQFLDVLLDILGIQICDRLLAAGHLSGAQHRAANEILGVRDNRFVCDDLAPNSSSLSPPGVQMVSAMTNIVRAPVSAALIKDRLSISPDTISIPFAEKAVDTPDLVHLRQFGSLVHLVAYRGSLAACKTEENKKVCRDVLNVMRWSRSGCEHC